MLVLFLDEILNFSDFAALLPNDIKQVESNSFKGLILTLLRLNSSITGKQLPMPSVGSRVSKGLGSQQLLAIWKLQTLLLLNLLLKQLLLQLLLSQLLLVQLLLVLVLQLLLLLLQLQLLL